MLGILEFPASLRGGGGAKQSLRNSKFILGILDFI